MLTAADALEGEGAVLVRRGIFLNGVLDKKQIGASAGGITLMSTVVHAGLSAAGMIGALPQSPRFVDDEFEVGIDAHTGPSGFALKGWSFVVQYDVGVLSLVSSSFSGVYQTPTSAHDSKRCDARLNGTRRDRTREATEVF